MNNRNLPSHHHHGMAQTTPPRRFMRGSKLVPSSVPTVSTPSRNYSCSTSKQPATSYQGGNSPYGGGGIINNRAMHTAPRSLYSSFNNNNATNNGNITNMNNSNNTTYAPSPMRTPHRQQQNQRTPGHCYTPGTVTPSKLDDDRFIPSRRRLNIDLCRRALVSSPGGGGETGSRGGAGGAPGQQLPQDPSAAITSTTTPSPSRPVSDETPLQKEFKRRMLSSLCNIPLDRLDEDGEPMSLLSFGSAAGSNENGNGGGGWNGRRNNNNYPLGSHHSNGQMNSSNTNGNISSSNNNLMMMNSPAMMVNPFEHDTLRQMKLGDADFDPAARLSVAKKVLRKVPSAPIRILDAPDIVDDYYLNLISWSKDNILAVALAQAVYLWNATTGEIQHLLTVDQGTDYITSVCWCPVPGQTKYIAVGTNTAQVHLFDGHALRKIRTLTGHTARVSALAWNDNWMTSGARDSLIINHDIRQANAIVNTYKGHEQEVCGLKWNEDGSTLASGGNENFLCLWDAAMSNTSSSSSSYGSRHNNAANEGDHAPRLILKQHKAAVKALDWCPFHRGLLASGGGTADRTIKFWNSSSGAMLNSIDTGSQVCSIVWSKHQRELCSSHGYSENQLILWKYPTMTKIKELTGHTARVLNMEMSPDGGSVVSAAADETLRFWNIFGSPNLHNRNPGSALVGDYPSFGVPTIR